MNKIKLQHFFKTLQKFLICLACKSWIPNVSHTSLQKLFDTATQIELILEKLELKNHHKKLYKKLSTFWYQKTQSVFSENILKSACDSVLELFFLYPGVRDSTTLEAVEQYLNHKDIESFEKFLNKLIKKSNLKQELVKGLQDISENVPDDLVPIILKNSWIESPSSRCELGKNLDTVEGFANIMKVLKCSVAGEEFDLEKCLILEIIQKMKEEDCFSKFWIPFFCEDHLGTILQCYEKHSLFQNAIHVYLTSFSHAVKYDFDNNLWFCDKDTDQLSYTEFVAVFNRFYSSKHCKDFVQQKLQALENCMFWCDLLINVNLS